MTKTLRALLVAAATAALVLLGVAPPAAAAQVTGTVTLDGVGYQAEVHIFTDAGETGSFTSNADGTFLIGAIPPGTYTLSVFTDSHLYQGFVSAPYTIDDEADEFVVNLPLLSWPTGTATISGTVTDAVTHTALVGAPVSFHGSGQAADQETTTDGSGHYTFTGIPSGEYSVSAGGPFGVEYVTRTVPQTVNDAEAVTLDFALVPADSTISVHVEDTDGNPIPGLYWSAVLDSDPTVEVFPPSATDASGNSTSNLIGAGAYTVKIGGDLTDWIEQTASVSMTAGGTPVVPFILERRPVGSFSFTVVDSTTTGINKICVDIYDVATGDAVGTPSGPIETDATGHIERDDLSPGTYTLLFWDCDYTREPAYEMVYLGHSPSLAHATSFTVTVGSDSPLGNIELGLGGNISGHLNVQAADGVVEFPSGRGSGLDATVFQLVDGVWEVVPDPSPFVGSGGPGDYDVRGLTPGTYRAGWFDPLSGPRSYADEYWNNQATLAAANDIVVTAGATVTADVTLGIPEPTGVPDPVATEDLDAADEGEISTESFATAGDFIDVEIDPAFAGEWMAAFGHSTPVPFGSWAQVSSLGAVTVPIPVTMPAGVHTLVVQNAEGEVMGWTTITIAAAPGGPLASTGAVTGWLVPAGVLLVLLGGVALMLRFRRA